MKVVRRPTYWTGGCGILEICMYSTARVSKTRHKHLYSFLDNQFDFYLWGTDLAISTVLYIYAYIYTSKD